LAVSTEPPEPRLKSVFEISAKDLIFLVAAVGRPFNAVVILFKEMGCRLPKKNPGVGQLNPRIARPNRDANWYPSLRCRSGPRIIRSVDAIHDVAHEIAR